MIKLWLFRIAWRQRHITVTHRACFSVCVPSCRALRRTIPMRLISHLIRGSGRKVGSWPSATATATVTDLADRRLAYYYDNGSHPSAFASRIRRPEGLITQTSYPLSLGTIHMRKNSKCVHPLTFRLCICKCVRMWRASQRWELPLDNANSISSL